MRRHVFFQVGRLADGHRPRRYDESHHDPNRGRNQGGDQEKEHSQAAEFAQGFGVDAGRSGHQAADHQRNDDHLQQPDENLTWEADVNHLGSR